MLIEPDSVRGCISQYQEAPKVTEYAPPSELEHWDEPPRASLRPFVERMLRTRSRRDSLVHRLPVPPSGRQYLTCVDGAPLYFYFNDRA